MTDLSVSPGQPSPLGASLARGGVNFAIYSENATAITLCLFSADGTTETDRIPLTAKTNHVWHVFVKGLKAGQLYGYRVDGPYAPQDGHRFNFNKLLIDPYARELFGEVIEHEAIYGFIPGHPDEDLSFSTLDSAPYVPKCVVSDKPRELNSDKPKLTKPRLIYEAHVKGLTQLHPKVPEKKRGTFSGLSTPIIRQHLKTICATHLELLPVHAFHSEPRLTQFGLTNYWGYNPYNFFALHQAYGAGEDFQKAVQTLRHNGIAVLLDVVYNHTAESWRHGPTLSFRGIDNAVYYRLQDDERFYVNHTGTGNTLNFSHPIVRELVLDSLRDAVNRFGVDGFRFDLGPVIGRTGQGFSKTAPIFEAIQNDPVLKNRIMIAEPWDIGPGGYQLGNFPNGWQEWNDRYRDDVRSYWTGAPGAHRALAGRLLGSADLFDHDGRSAQSSINFITAHDGFNLTDLVSYTQKHNHANGEDNRDGHGHNLSVNFGHEGPSDDPEIIEKRMRRKRSLLATLMLSQGTPMILAGDEIGHSQQGNNNAYCQDNEISWLNWADADQELMDCVAQLSQLRAKFPQLTQDEFLHGQRSEKTGARNVLWIGPDGEELGERWEHDDTVLGMCLNDDEAGALLVVFNRGDAVLAPVLDKGFTVEFCSHAAPQDGMIAADSVSVYSRQNVYLTPSEERKQILKRAEFAGILPGYTDISGGYHKLNIDTAKTLLNALGDPVPNTSSPDDNIRPVYGAEQLREKGKVWGVTASLYGLRSARNWGMGDFEDLARLAEILAKQGADFLGINPVHALFPSAPHLYAPYSPSSRQFLNVMHIAVDQLPEWDGEVPKAAIKARQREHVDYALTYKAKWEGFESAFANFQSLPKTSSRKKEFEKFKAAQGEALTLHCLYDVLFERLPKSKQSYQGWKNFPKSYHDPKSKAVARAVETYAERIELYAYLQFCAHEQLLAAQERAKAAGMSIGLYLDLAVGVTPGGSDVWQDRDSFAVGAGLGAPGDMANPDGQAWGLAPYNPSALRANNMEPYRSTLTKLCAYGGAVRIDHILGHLRSFLIPDQGGPGGYVSYPFEALTRMIADVSQETETLIIGEDLGTVPQGFREALAERDLMGCGIYLIDRDSQEQLFASHDLRKLSLTAFTNHDFPTLTGFWQGEDFKWREQLGIGAHPDTLRFERDRREKDKAFLLSQIGWGTAENMSGGLMAELQGWLAESPALAFAVPLEDVLLDPAQPNIPGTTTEVPNWRRRMKTGLEELESSAEARQIMDKIKQGRERA